MLDGSEVNFWLQKLISPQPSIKVRKESKIKHHQRKAEGLMIPKRVSLSKSFHSFLPVIMSGTPAPL